MPAAAAVPTTLHVCLRDDADELAARFEQDGFGQEEDVLDTWFSSALWPHSTLGWPSATPDLQYFYPTSVLITSRDIITLWVARMVLTGLNNMGEVPFRDVYIHPKILDGYGETMSKSKGNGVDPIDVIDKFGPDALRFGLAHLTTETQDVRMPVQFECPHCEQLIDQTKKNREMPRIVCPSASSRSRRSGRGTDADRQLKRGAVVSERFEGARNFCNKLWNAARFVMLNLEHYTAGTVADAELAFEDRWILSRLTTVTQQVTEALEQYRYADAARTLYDFCWVEFCSSYIEMIKGRFQDPRQRVVAQRMAAYTLDVILRLLHPLIPFITEEIWQLLGSHRAATRAGDGRSRRRGTSSWPPGRSRTPSRLNTAIEEQFAQFHAVLSALREIRSRQNMPPRQPMPFALAVRRGHGRAAAAAHGTLRGLGRGPRHEHGSGRAAAADQRHRPPAQSGRVRRLVGSHRCGGGDQPPGKTARTAVRYDCRQGEEAGQQQLCRKGARRRRAQGAGEPPAAARTTGHGAQQPGRVGQDLVAFSVRLAAHPARGR